LVTVITMENTESAAPPTPRTAAATAARRRAREEAAATLLESRGWEVFTPEGENWTLRKARLQQDERRALAS
jgi:hypothetical protein